MRQGVVNALIAALNEMDPDEHLLPAEVIELIYEVAQQEQIERCPIYGGMCYYPSELCFECPLHKEDDKMMQDLRNDLVRRGDVMDELVKEYNRRWKDGGLKLAWIEKAVDSVRPVAQPEIIRCKDCKHFAGEGMYCSCDIIVQFDDDVYDAIEYAPTIDPVKHGEWIYTDEGYMCTSCEKSVYGCGLEVMTGQYRYCPNCGAKMERSEE